MSRRLLAASVILALGTGAWWIARGMTQDGDALRVDVTVHDVHAQPVPGAQVEAVFDGRVVRPDEEGRAVLQGLVLRELDDPSPEAIARALRVRAPHHALREGAAPEVRRGEDGSWHARYTLTGHGILRLFVDETHLGPCLARPEASPGGRTWEPIGGTQVARFGSPASYRVYGGPEHLVVRIEGVADRDGAIGVATRRLTVEAPAPGTAREVVVAPTPAAPIIGQIVVPEGSTPPSLGGWIRITPQGDEAGGEPLAEVRVQPDGSFVARRTGTGRFRLAVRLHFVPGITQAVARGGGTVEIRPASAPLWATLRHPGLDTSRETTFTVGPADGDGDGDEDARPAAASGSAGLSHVALPGPGAWRVGLVREGTAEAPPRRATASVQASDAGGHEVEVEPEVAPHGTLVVAAGAAAFGDARGATVTVGGRRATLLPGLARKAVFEHVAAGEQRVEVSWEGVKRPIAVHTVEVPSGGRMRLDLGATGGP